MAPEPLLMKIQSFKILKTGVTPEKAVDIEGFPNKLQKIGAFASQYYCPDKVIF
jgi:hypothetical protein